MLKVLFLFLLIIAAPVLIILALIDILRSEYSGMNKVVWVLVVIFLPLIGSILYFGIGRNQKITS
jgi:hypothetical protein